VVGLPGARVPGLLGVIPSRLDGGGELGAGLLGGGVVPDPVQQAGGEAFLAGARAGSRG